MMKSRKTSMVTNRVTLSSAKWPRHHQQQHRRAGRTACSASSSTTNVDGAAAEPPAGATRSRQVMKPKCQQPMDWELNTARLDPSNNPEHAQRLKQRRKDVSKGKNTVCYTEYLQKVPLEKRIPRSLKTPSTPDPTLDISNKRWQGQIRAWRKSLHQYDPADLMTSFGGSTSFTSTESSSSATADGVGKTTPVQARQLQEAADQGLLVDLNNNHDAAALLPDQSPISIMSDDVHQDELLDLDDKDMSGAGGLLDDENDSDDDLL